jgi:N-acetylglucosaminyl-diphospho-decaprenol L-rhamnosyltransferase
MEPTNKKQPLITLSIVSHGDWECIEPLLESLGRHEQPDRLQIILTDNLGNEIPERAGGPGLTLIRNRSPLGFASNQNQAFRSAAGMYFCILNPDVVFEDEIFPPLIGRLQSGQADIIAPLIVDSSAAPQDSFRAFPTPFEVVRRRLPGYRFMPPAKDEAGLVRPDWFAGMFMLMKSETFIQLQGFDERYHLYFEDVDFCARAQLAGLKLVVDTNIRVQHNAHRASRKKFVYLLWHLQSALRFFTSPVYKRIARKQK